MKNDKEGECNSASLIQDYYSVHNFEEKGFSDAMICPETSYFDNKLKLIFNEFHAIAYQSLANEQPTLQCKATLQKNIKKFIEQAQIDYSRGFKKGLQIFEK